MTGNTPPNNPPLRTSDEANQEQLRLARAQGEALKAAVEYMTKQEADDGSETRAGDFRVGYAVESAEGVYQLRGGELVWEEPDQENVHVEVSVRDGGDGRFVPGLEVFATLVDEAGREVGTHQQPFLWHPWLYHYGRNWTVPGDGTYTLRVRIEPPQFGRHDKENGKRYAEPVHVEFTDVKIKTGRK